MLKIKDFIVLNAKKGMESMGKNVKNVPIKCVSNASKIIMYAKNV